MSYCINPHCPQPQNTDISMFCVACGSDLLLQGCYRVIRPLGIGGFGKTFEIEDNGTQKILKVLHNTQPKAIELFQQEAAVLQQLHHPGIPRVEADGYFIFHPKNSPPLHCLIMEKIEGMNLETWMQARNHEPIIERAAIRWLKQLIEILQVVHQKQYFHRDIKPPNIILRPNGQLALIDFGTAREVTQTFMHKLEGQQVTGIISAGYTPSEQMNGKAVPQSDFFALGRTFVYLLTGKNPTEFNEEYHTGQLKWREQAHQISPGLADLIDGMMQPFPGNRPQNATEILQRLQTIEQAFVEPTKSTRSPQVPVTVHLTNTPQPPPSKPPIKLLAGVSIMLLGGIGAYYAYQNLTPSKSPVNVDVNISKNIMISPNSTNPTPTPTTIITTNNPTNNQPTSTPTSVISPTPITCVIEVADPDDPTLNVRSGPSVDDTLIGQLENGTPISVVQTQNGWYLIDQPLKGWLAANRTRRICN
ncbi:serine/threonine protein kinase [Nostoc sp. CMAA1605]|uniref:serine/threonine protein kinase n=1 Tax=Nostoc sp. CMAA1605 TaxID=2055159 RepID=UPI001F3F45BA|nr:serine/threonine protein kinase [Nostoc sp. CMAA1605]MCF4966393.1 serine/threonine protein kinase [Nostoc sp. CMAA1605]